MYFSSTNNLNPQVGLNKDSTDYFNFVPILFIYAVT